MSRAVVSVTASTTVSDACVRMGAEKVGCTIVLDATGAVLGIFTERDLLCRVVGAGLDPTRTAVAQVMTPNPVVLTSTTPIAAAAEELNDRGFRHVPVVSTLGALVGVVSMRDLFRIRQARAQALLDEEVRQLQELRALLGAGESSRLSTLLSVNRRLHEIALTDELTGLYNHRHFRRRLDEELSRSNRVGAPLALMLADIDRFENVNEEQGQLVGDLVLRHVGQTLRDAVEGASIFVRLRRSDIVARYGGGEFAILLLDARSSGAVDAAERIRRAVEHLRVPVCDGLEVKVTISIGVAALPDDATDADALIAAADAALRAAKEHGRNRVRRAAAVSSPSLRG